jgi:hypothetical protein
MFESWCFLLAQKNYQPNKTNIYETFRFNIICIIYYHNWYAIQLTNLVGWPIIPVDLGF